jgi:hypothetical protein
MGTDPMTAFLRRGYHEVECNYRLPDLDQCPNMARVISRQDGLNGPYGRTIAAALRYVTTYAGWQVVEPIVPDGGIHLCPHHRENS